MKQREVHQSQDSTYDSEHAETVRRMLSIAHLGAIFDKAHHQRVAWSEKSKQWFWLIPSKGTLLYTRGNDNEDPETLYSKFGPSQHRSHVYRTHYQKLVVK